MQLRYGVGPGSVVAGLQAFDFLFDFALEVPLEARNFRKNVELPRSEPRNQAAATSRLTVPYGLGEPLICLPRSATAPSRKMKTCLCLWASLLSFSGSKGPW